MTNLDPNVNAAGAVTTTTTTTTAGTESKKVEKEYTDSQKAGMEELSYLLKDIIDEEKTTVDENQAVDAVVDEVGEEKIAQPDRISVDDLRSTILNISAEDQTAAENLESLKKRMESDGITDETSAAEVKSYLSSLGLSFGEDDTLSIAELTAFFASYKAMEATNADETDTKNNVEDLTPSLQNVNYVTAVLDSLMGVENAPEVDLETDATGVLLAQVISEQVLTKDEDGNLTAILSDLGETLLGYGKDMSGEDYSDILAKNKNIFLAMALQELLTEDENGDTVISQDKIDAFKQEHVRQGAKNVIFENGQVAGYSLLNAEGIEEFIQITGRDANGITNMIIKNAQENPTQIIEMVLDAASGEMVISKTLTDILYNQYNQQKFHTVTTPNGVSLDISNIRYESNNADARITAFTQIDSNGITKNMVVTYDAEGNPTVKEVKNNPVTVNNDTANVVNIFDIMPSQVSNNNNLQNIVSLLLGMNNNKNMSQQTAMLMLLFGILSAIQNITQVSNQQDSMLENLQTIMALGAMLYPHANEPHMCKPETPWWEAEQNMEDTTSVLMSKMNRYEFQSEYSGNYAADASADFISSQIFNKSGNGSCAYYTLNNNGQKLLQLGYQAGAKNQEEAMKLGMQQLDFNRDGLIEFPEMASFEYDSYSYYQNAYEGKKNMNDVVRTLVSRNGNNARRNDLTYTNNNKANMSADFLSNMIYSIDRKGRNRLNENGERLVAMGRSLAGYKCGANKALELALKHLDYNKDGLMNAAEMPQVVQSPFVSFLKNWTPFNRR